MKKIVSALLVSILTAFIITGCKSDVEKSSSSTKKQLVISYSDSVFGSDWLNSICEEYKKNNKDIEIKLSPDNNIDKKARSMLEDENTNSDIMILSSTNWQYWVERNYLADLTGLYKSEVEDSKTFEKMVKADCQKYFNYNGKYYAVQFDDSVGGFIYNKKMFEKYGWSLPKNMKEFSSLILEIKSEGIVPIAWGGKNINDWDVIVKSWWAQNVGLSDFNNYLKLPNPQVYDQKGREDALIQFSKIVSDQTNSIADVEDSDNQKALNMFLSGKAAFYIGKSSVEYAANKNMMEDFSMALMQVPPMENAKDSSLNVVPSNGIMVVPSQSKNIPEAIDFLRFMSTSEMLRLFTAKTSTPRPFYYDTEDIHGLSNFGQTVLDYYKKANLVYMYSENPLYYNNLSDWPYKGAPYLRIFKNLITPQDAVEENYLYVKENWNSLKKQNS